MYVCEVCGREYQTKSWLDRHMELKHGTRAEEERPRDTGDTQEPETREAVSSIDVASLLTRACEALGIDKDDVLSSRVYGDRVVVVEGPVGYKRMWSIE
jgi:hypothetical protein